MAPKRSLIQRRDSLAALAASLAQAAPARKPNIVLIVADDLGYGELGCQGNPQFPTPHIDSIAKGGVRFTNGYVTAPFCSPSHAGLMMGRYQTRFGRKIYRSRILKYWRTWLQPGRNSTVRWSRRYGREPSHGDRHHRGARGG